MAMFIGEVKTIWLTEPDEKDRKMRLLEDFTFVDDNNVEWTAPAGCTIDGASIPTLGWSTFPGPPYVGNYRRASVVHDYFCAYPGDHSMEEVHVMFHDAMKADGVSSLKAFTMFTAVKLFGPKEPVPEGVSAFSVMKSTLDSEPDFTGAELNQLINNFLQAK